MSAVKRHSPAVVLALATLFALIDATSQAVAGCFCLIFTTTLVIAEREWRKFHRRCR